MIRKQLLPAAPIPGRLRLMLLAFLMLFVELALIRWTGTNVVYLPRPDRRNRPATRD